MTLPIPLSVRLKTARAGRHIERDLRSLSFRETVHGYASAQFSLDRPLSMSADEIAYYGDVDIDDMRNAGCAWCGRLEDPGRGVGADGQVWSLAAVGPTAHAQDRRLAYVVIDSQPDNWERDTNSKRVVRTDVEISDDDNDLAALVDSWPEGSTVTAGDHASFMYLAIRRAGQNVARVRTNVTDAVTSATNWEDRIATRAVGTSWNIRHSATWSTTSHQLAAAVGGTNSIPVGEEVAALRTVRLTSGTIANPDANAQFADVVIRALLVDALGNNITTGYNNNYVLAHEIVNDLLGRFLTSYDAATATVDTSSAVQIDQAAWPDAVTPADVLDELMILEPTKYWRVTDRLSNGKYKFVWRTWPTHVRYEADVVDGFDSPGSADGLYNAVTIRWRGALRASRTRRRTQTVPVLDAAGIIREDTLDLGENIGSAANALQAGDQFLGEHAVPPNAGTLTVARPIYDHDRGTRVMPWEIKPGHLIRVRGVQPHPNSLNASTRDGVSVFRIVAKDYSTDSAAATLELDSYSYTTARALARLEKRIRKQRRR